MNRGIKQDLIDFSIAQEQCLTKIREHESNIEYWLRKKRNAKLFCINNSLRRLMIRNLDLNIEIEKREVRKWKSYFEILSPLHRSDERINESDIENARRYDLVTLVGQDIGLKKAGSIYMAKCPFHNEDTASFIVKSNTYYCFGCREHGDSIDWLTKYRGMVFIDAVKFLTN